MSSLGTRTTSRQGGYLTIGQSPLNSPKKRKSLGGPGAPPRPQRRRSHWAATPFNIIDRYETVWRRPRRFTVSTGGASSERESSSRLLYQSWMLWIILSARWRTTIFNSTLSPMLISIMLFWIHFAATNLICGSNFLGVGCVECVCCALIKIATWNHHWWRATSAEEKWRNRVERWNNVRFSLRYVFVVANNDDLVRPGRDIFIGPHANSRRLRWGSVIEVVCEWLFCCWWSWWCFPQNEAKRHVVDMGLMAVSHRTTDGGPPLVMTNRPLVTAK